MAGCAANNDLLPDRFKMAMRAKFIKQQAARIAKPRQRHSLDGAGKGTEESSEIERESAFPVEKAHASSDAVLLTPVDGDEGCDVDGNAHNLEPLLPRSTKATLTVHIGFAPDSAIATPVYTPAALKTILTVLVGFAPAPVPAPSKTFLTVPIGSAPDSATAGPDYTPAGPKAIITIPTFSANSLDTIEKLTNALREFRWTACAVYIVDDQSIVQKDWLASKDILGQSPEDLDALINIFMRDYHYHLSTTKGYLKTAELDCVIMDVLRCIFSCVGTVTEGCQVCDEVLSFAHAIGLDVIDDGPGRKKLWFVDGSKVDDWSRTW